MLTTQRRRGVGKASSRYNTMNRQTVVIVLAAGRGSRFAGPQHKLVQGLGPASVLGQTILHAIESRLPVIVVATQALAAEAARWVARRDVEVVPDGGLPGAAGSAALGIGYSIAAGVSARPQADGWLVLPGDMPLVQPGSIRAVAAALAQHPVVCAQHRGRRGHPVGFAAELFSELVQLSGDEGARRIVARYPSVGLELDDSGVLFDVDTEADLAVARAALAGADVSLPASG
jgi:molybdenum cofactor cytidylyltransferase